jgi:hypothetical protein
VLGWLKSEQRDRRRKIRLDRKQLEVRARHFLKSYLKADEKQKPEYYRAVEEASKKCQPAKSGLPSSELGDAQIAEAAISELARQQSLSSIQLIRTWKAATIAAPWAAITSPSGESFPVIMSSIRCGLS